MAKLYPTQTQKVSFSQEPQHKFNQKAYPQRQRSASILPILGIVITAALLFLLSSNLNLLWRKLIPALLVINILFWLHILDPGKAENSSFSTDD